MVCEEAKVISTLIARVGDDVGTVVGSAVGNEDDGIDVGVVGRDVGTLDVGAPVGCPLGSPLGTVVGGTLGVPDGCDVGILLVGIAVGNDDEGTADGAELPAVQFVPILDPNSELGLSAGHAIQVKLASLL